MEKSTRNSKLKRIAYHLVWLFVIFAILLTLYTLFEIIFSGKAQIDAWQLLNTGGFALVCFIFSVIRSRQMKKKEDAS